MIIILIHNFKFLKISSKKAKHKLLIIDHVLILEPEVMKEDLSYLSFANFN